MSSSASPRSLQVAAYQEPMLSALPFIGRLLIGAIFLVSGCGKLSAPAGTIAFITSVGVPFPQLAYGAAVVFEIAGGLMLITGYRARAVAAFLAAFCVVTALTFHNDLANQNQFLHFFKNIAIAGGLFQIIAFGAGRLSFDAWRRANSGA
jgi:putative oxidoreductase